jgi:serine phosphatase RsbU (regulator of sigma subunit)
MKSNCYMKSHVKVLFLFILLASFSEGFSQDSPFDSLTRSLNTAPHDSVRASILIELGKIHTESDIPKAFECYNRALDIIESNLGNERVFQDLLIVATRYIGILYLNQSATDKALEYFQKSLKLSEELDFTKEIAASLNNIGLVHDDLMNHNLSIEYYRKSIEYSLLINDDFGVARGYNNIGVSSSRMGNILMAIDNYTKAAEAFEKLGLTHFLASTHNNIGTYYLGLIHSEESPDSTLAYYQKALRSFESAAKAFKEAREIFNYITVVANLAQTHRQISNILPKGHPDKEEHMKIAIAYGNESIEKAKEFNAFSTIYYASHALMDAYKSQGNISKALEFAELIISNNDSLNSQDRRRIAEEVEAQYQTAKKQQEIENQNILLENKTLDARRQKTMRNAIIVALLLTMILASIIYKGYKAKAATNEIILEKNQILEQANAEILAQRDELEAQRDMVLNQNKELEDMQRHTTHSLQYAQSIQAAILPSEQQIEKISPDYFIFMKPCELVSGDFFWAAHFDQYQVFCVADCTGHGVPGAFMSILGITALNDIVTRHRITKPSEILRLLRESVIEALSQNDPEQLHRDGMDIGLCVYNTKTFELQFAGAGIPLWVVTRGETNGKFGDRVLTSENGYSLFDIKADRTPVGQSPLHKPFTNHIFNLEKSDGIRIYLATDGFADQFESSSKSKYRKIRLKSFILENCHKKMKLQKDALDAEFNNWMGSGYQVDDAAILGLHF